MFVRKGTAVLVIFSSTSVRVSRMSEPRPAIEVLESTFLLPCVWANSNYFPKLMSVCLSIFMSITWCISAFALITKHNATRKILAQGFLRALNSGAIPTELGNLVNLKELSLNENALTGE